LLGAQPFNYTDAVDALPNAIHAFSTNQGLVSMVPDAHGNSVNQGFIDQNGLFQQAGPVGRSVSGCVSSLQLLITMESDDAVKDALIACLNLVISSNAPGLSAPQVTAINSNNSPLAGNNFDAQSAAADICTAVGSHDVSVFNGWNSSPDGFNNSPSQLARGYGGPQFGVDKHDGQMVGVSDAGTFVLSETALTMHCWGQNPVVTAKLQLNGQDRFSEREGTYFDLVQPFQHHTRNPDTGINLYSFALRPEEHQPSGTCNFSRIDNATLQLVLSNATVEGTKTAKVRVYATNYNVLRVMSGMGGLAYSN
jgi:hypothetical protein